ncbi:MAG: DUF4127 family protein, partial [Firmicutes bacterium]|nr:DUF4127 family protein [Bacillota bacterium]
ITCQYETLGFNYCFIHNISLYPVDKPAGYSKSEAQRWQDEGRHTVVPEIKPNIVFVMCEAFSDITDEPMFEYTEENDPLKAFHELQNDGQTVSGRLIVPNYAAGTANTEFDVLTGMQTTMIGEGTTSAFRVVRKNTAGIASALLEQGYSTYFMHPGQSWFYNRDNVYRWFGFGERVFADVFSDEDKKGTMISDEAFLERLESDLGERILKSEDPLLAYAVTIQNHQTYNYAKYGDLPLEEVPLSVSVSDETREFLEVYIEGVKDSSDMIAKLAEYTDSLDEPVLLVFYGDHKPNLGGSYEDLGISFEGEDILRKYEVPYIIRANRAYERYVDLSPADGAKISANYLGAMVLELCGFRGLDTYIDYINAIRKQIPVYRLDDSAYVLSDGSFTTDPGEEIAGRLDVMHKWMYYRLKTYSPDIDPGVVPEKMPENTIAYIPLDDRPNNNESMVWMAQSIGYRLLIPDEDWFSTSLEGQENNSNGTPYGDRAKLYEWLLEQEKAGCDRYMISLDQLLSGGLVNSRAISGSDPVTLSDGRVLSETELLEELIGILAGDPYNRVWFMDTVMRLAPTAGYSHWTLDDYNNVRAYATVPRQELDEGDLTIEKIISLTTLGADGKTIPTSKYSVSDEKLEEYLGARERKLRLTDSLFRLIGSSGSPYFHVLMGVDDSSEEFCVQRNEIAFIRTLLREGDALLSGADDMGFKVLAKLYMNEHGLEGGKIDVVYVGDSRDERACAFDYRSLETIVDEHLGFFGYTQDDSAELKMVILTHPKTKGANSFLDDFIRTVGEYCGGGFPTIMVDASNNAYGSDYRGRFKDEIELGRLIAYAGQLDMANVTGTAMSHGIARYSFLLSGDSDPISDEGFMYTMADVLVKDLCYRTAFYENMANYVNRTLESKSTNFDTKRVETKALKYLRDNLDGRAEELLDGLAGTPFISSLAPRSEGTWRKIELTNAVFPWHRTFEISIDLK